MAVKNRFFLKGFLAVSIILSMVLSDLFMLPVYADPKQSVRTGWCNTFVLNASFPERNDRHLYLDNRSAIETAMLSGELDVDRTYIGDYSADSSSEKINSLQVLSREYHMVIMLVLVLLVLALAFILYKRNQYSKQIRSLLYTDELTGLYSVKGFEEKAKHLLAQYSDRPYFIVDFDINHFEEYNAANGFEAGNALLKVIANITESFYAQGDIAARVQADHFVCLVTESSVEKIVEKLHEANKVFRRASENNSLLISYGIYEITDRTVEITGMRDCAMVAKRTVKGNYHNFIAIYDEALHKRQLYDIRLLNRFENALAAGELTAYYQPQYDIQTQKIIGAEALVRWFTKEGGTIMPDQFIGLLEQNGLIGKLDLYMFELVCQKISRMKEDKEPTVSISINISRSNFYDQSFVNKLMSLVEKYDIPKPIIELTETAFFENQHEMMRVLKRLREWGFVVAIDDFGSGFSSLNLIKDVRFDIIKIDRGFLSTTSGTERGEIVIQNMLQLAQDLDFRTVAEGVESKDQYELLKKYGCEVAQGYYFSKPISEETFDELMNQQRRVPCDSVCT